MNDMTMSSMTFDCRDYAEFVESSFTKRKEAKAWDRIWLNFVYRAHRIRVQCLVAISYCYLWIMHPQIVRIQYNLRRNGGLSGNYQWIRLAEIARLVKKFKPVSVLECGSGASSAVFGLLCPGNAVTLENSAQWKEHLLRGLGSLAEKMSVRHVDRVIEESDGEMVCHFNTAHDAYVDCVYVDGPYDHLPEPTAEALAKVRDPQGHHLALIDVELFWRNGIFPRLVLIDGKRSTVRRLIGKGQERYDIYLKSDFWFQMGIAKWGRYHYHTVMVRRDSIKEE